VAFGFDHSAGVFGVGLLVGEIGDCYVGAFACKENGYCAAYARAEMEHGVNKGLMGLCLDMMGR
jgi:hypothetical protein